MKISTKLGSIAFGMLLACLTVSAQTTETGAKTPNTVFTPSIFFQFQSGFTYGIGQDARFVNLLSPSLEFAVGYHIRPMWSVRIEGGYGQGRGSLNKHVYTYQYASLFFDGMFNIINAFDYNPDRICNLYLFAGIAPLVGIQSVKDKALTEALNSNWKPGSVFFAGRVGASFSVNVTKHFALLGEIAYIGSSDKLDCKVTNDITSLFNAKIGFQYSMMAQNTPKQRAEKVAREYLSNERNYVVLGTNFIDWAYLGTANIWADVSVGRHFAVGLGAKFNPWEFDIHKTNPLMARQTFAYVNVKYYPWYVFDGWHFDLLAGWQDFKDSDLAKTQNIISKGNRVGAGLTVGYTYIICKCMNLELNAGFWAGRENSESFYTMSDSQAFKTDTKGFFRASNITIGLSWVLNPKKDSRKGY